MSEEEDIAVHSHPIIFEVPSELLEKMDKVLDSLDYCSESLGDVAKTSDSILNKIEDTLYERKYNKPTPQELYRSLYEWYLENDSKEQAEELQTLCRIHRYDYRLAVLTYETKFYKSHNNSDEESI